MMGVAIRDWVKYNKGRNLFDACNFKGTFVNCNSTHCITCHKEGKVTNRTRTFLEEKWEPVISAKPKHRGCIFIRVQHRKPTCFIMKIYGHNQAQEVVDVIITEHNAKVDAEA